MQGIKLRRRRILNWPAASRKINPAPAAANWQTKISPSGIGANQLKGNTGRLGNEASSSLVFCIRAVELDRAPQKAYRARCGPLKVYAIYVAYVNL